MNEQIEAIVSKIKSDKNFANDFISDPVKAIESIIGKDLPNDVINTIISGVKSKVLSDKKDTLLGGIKNIF